jgi:hypothetical protein
VSVSLKVFGLFVFLFILLSCDILPRRGIVKLLLARESLVNYIPAGDEKMAKLFLQCNILLKTQ